MLRMSEIPAAGDRRRQWWANVDLVIVGFANAELLTDDTGDAYGYLMDFYIVPERRRQGHGEAFARLVFQWMKEHGATWVSLHTRLDSPAATAFWRHLGCEPRLYVMRKLLD
jgi:ribosomal protein S18 acetylase RimI-like enzyme